MKLNRALLCAALLLSPAIVFAAEPGSRPKIGLALSGGGAKGAAHIGVLRKLEEMNVPIDYVAGTSMGAVVGALYASGMSPDEIERELTTIDWEEAFSDSTPYRELIFRRKREIVRYPSTAEVGFRDGKLVLPAALRTGQKLTFLLGRYLLPQLDQRDFTKLPVPFTAVAADLDTGKPVYLTSGDLAEAVRASMAIPGFFTPVDWNGQILVDGGVAMNLPVDAVRAMGADVVIAVDISAELTKQDKNVSAFGVVGQLTTILTRSNVEAQLPKADLVVKPDISGYGTFSFADGAAIVQRGVAAAEASRPQLVKYAIDPAEAAAMIRARRVPRDHAVTIDAIEITGANVVNADSIRERIRTRAGERLDLDVLERDIANLYGWGDFIGIHFGLEKKDGRNVLVLRIQEKPWGPNYVRAGITFAASEDDTNVAFLANYTRRWVNRRGGEWRNDLVLGRETSFETEFYQPRKLNSPFFLSAGGGFSDRRRDLYVDGDPVSEFRVKQLYAYGDAGLQLRTTGEVRTGLFYRSTDSEVVKGAAIVPGATIDESGLTVRLLVDTLDNPFIPRSGVATDFRVIAPLEALGSDDEYATVALFQSLYLEMGRHTVFGRVYAQDTYGGTPTPFDLAALGGSGRLAGYAPAQFVNVAAAAAGIGYYAKIADLKGLGEGVYAGGVFEAGDVYADLSDVDVGDLRYSGTVILGMNTNYGPAFLSVSKATEASTRFSLTVGRTF